MNAPEKTKIAIASDHAGFELKEKIKSFLHQKGYETSDFGTRSAESVDYPDYIHPMAQAVNNGEFALGIALCGSGNGVSMTANKYKAVRAAVCWQKDIAELARQHNNANVCAIPARFVSDETAKTIVQAFLTGTFDGGRHTRRVEKI